jgi:hypothetical protein
VPVVVVLQLVGVMESVCLRLVAEGTAACAYPLMLAQGSAVIPPLAVRENHHDGPLRLSRGHLATLSRLGSFYTSGVLPYGSRGGIGGSPYTYIDALLIEPMLIASE